MGTGNRANAFADKNEINNFIDCVLTNYDELHENSIEIKMGSTSLKLVPTFKNCDALLSMLSGIAEEQ